jgi:O-antigen/teichoic acid export membrane protein
MELRILGLLAFAVVAAVGYRSARQGFISDRRFRASAILSLIVALGAAAALLFGGAACDANHRSGLSGAVMGIVIGSVFAHILLASCVVGRPSGPTSNIRLERPAG